jgi:hypothetical protein
LLRCFRKAALLTVALHQVLKLLVCYVDALGDEGEHWLHALVEPDQATAE